MRQVVSRHHHDLRSVGRVNMPGFQAKVLVVTWTSGDNFQNYSSQLYGQLGLCAPTKLNFLFYKRRPLFNALSNVYQTDVWSVLYTGDRCHCTEQNKKRLSQLLICDRTLKFDNKICPKSEKVFEQYKRCGYSKFS